MWVGYQGIEKTHFWTFQMRTTISRGHSDILDHNSILGEDL